MNRILLVFFVSFAWALVGDEVKFATQEDLSAFDQLIAPPPLPRKPNPAKTKSPTQSRALLRQDRDFGMIVSDESRQIREKRALIKSKTKQPTQRAIVPNK